MRLKATPASCTLTMASWTLSDLPRIRSCTSFLAIFFLLSTPLMKRSNMSAKPGAVTRLTGSASIKARFGFHARA